MPNLNSVMLMGNITRDIELRYTPGGTAVCELSIAINRKWKDGSGKLVEEVTFVECELWDKTAEVAAEYLGKGKPIFIQGRLKQESWEDKSTGQKRSKMKVVGERIEFLGKKEDGESKPSAGRKVIEKAVFKPSLPKAPDVDSDDDVPF